MRKHRAIIFVLIGIVALAAIGVQVTPAYACYGDHSVKQENATHWWCHDNQTGIDSAKWEKENPSNPDNNGGNTSNPGQPANSATTWSNCGEGLLKAMNYNMEAYLNSCPPLPTKPAQSVVEVKKLPADCFTKDMILGQVPVLKDTRIESDVWIHPTGAKNGKGAWNATNRPQLVGIASNASFSPDGCFLVLALTKPGEKNADLFVIGTTGSFVRQITKTPDVNETAPDWARDWSIFYSRDGVLTVTDQWGRKHNQLGNEGFLVDASPDGNLILYSDGNSTIFLAKRDGKEVVNTGQQGTNVVWEPTGKGFAFAQGLKIKFFNFETGEATEVEGIDAAFDPKGKEPFAEIHGFTKTLGMSVGNNLFVGERMVNDPVKGQIFFPDWWTPSVKRVKYQSKFAEDYMAAQLALADVL